MQMSSRTYFKVAVVFLGLLLSLGLFLAMSGATEKASALDASEWAKVRGYLDSFITSQYTPDAVDGESGFLIDSPTLKGLIDSNGDNVFLGEGDDAANAPVVVDVLNGGGGGIIPTTAVISTWNSTTLNAATTNLIKTKVMNHEAAGFSTDIVSYCLTGHTESVAAGGMGAISYAGGYGGTTPSTVLDLKWGRWGWASGSHAYSKTNTLAAPSVSPGGYPDATEAACTGSTPDSELVRCAAASAASAIGSGFMAGATTGYSGKQVIDIRPGSVGSNSVGNSAITYQVPINTVFNTGLNDIYPTGVEVLVANRTQHSAGIVGVGLEMLGFDSNFSKWGLAEYNNTIGEQFTGGAGYPLVAAVIDNTAPTITTGPSATPGATSASIALATDEPATTMVSYGTTSGGPYSNSMNDTVLNASSTANLSGLTPGTTYYASVTACDGQANCTTAAEISFTTTCTSGMPALTLMAPSAYWASMADYNNGVLSVDWSLNTGADTAYNVSFSSAPVWAQVTALNSPVSVGTIAASSSAVATVQYQIPAGASAFAVINGATAEDQCGTGYTYP